MARSNLINHVALSPNFSRGPFTKDTITIHHMAGNLTVEQCGNVFASSNRQASANYGIDNSGRVGLYVEEFNRSWASSSASNDQRAITIEVANINGAPNWEVGPVAYDKLIELCADICKRHNIKHLNFTGNTHGNMTTHNMFVATACPGPFLQARQTDLQNKINNKIKKGGDDEMKIVDLKAMGLMANGNERGYFGEFDRRLYIKPTRKKINDWNIALTIPQGAEVDISCIAFDEEGHYLAPCKYVANGRQHMGFVVVNTAGKKQTDWRSTQTRTTANGLNATASDSELKKENDQLKGKINQIKNIVQ